MSEEEKIFMSLRYKCGTSTLAKRMDLLPQRIMVNKNDLESINGLKSFGYDVEDQTQ